MHINLNKKNVGETGFSLIGILIAITVIAFIGGGAFYTREIQQKKSIGQIGIEKIKEAEALKQKIEEQNKQIQSMLDNDKHTFPSEKPLTMAIDTSNWKTYRNEKFGFEVKYPTTHFVQDTTSKNKYQNRVLLLTICKIKTGDGDCEGALIDVFAGSVPKKFQYPDNVRSKALEKEGYFFQFLGDEKIFSTFKFTK